jgi:hypothetical protein
VEDNKGGTHMSLSMKQAVDSIKEMKKNGVNSNDLGFVATVLRDNEEDGTVHDFAQLVMDYISEK